jgi:hypothetical protein
MTELPLPHWGERDRVTEGLNLADIVRTSNFVSVHKLVTPMGGPLDRNR